MSDEELVDAVVERLVQRRRRRWRNTGMVLLKTVVPLGSVATILTALRIFEVL